MGMSGVLGSLTLTFAFPGDFESRGHCENEHTEIGLIISSTHRNRLAALTDLVVFDIMNFGAGRRLCDTFLNAITVECCSWSPWPTPRDLVLALTTATCLFGRVNISQS